MKILTFVLVTASLAGVSLTAVSPAAISLADGTGRALARDDVPAKPVPAQPASASSANGVVSGRVVFDGKKPELKPLTITAEASKGCCPGDKRVNEQDPSLLIDEKGGLANVVLTIEVPDSAGAPGAKLEIPKDAIPFDQKQCMFEPHVLVIPAGAKVAFLNSDTIVHSVQVISFKNEGANHTISPGAKEEMVFAKGDKISIKCGYHPWMSGWIFVSETPYYALTKPDGSFSISGLKPGKYKVKLWHEALGRGEAEAVIKDDGTCAPLEIKMAERKKKG